jgi:hypothetical protein
MSGFIYKTFLAIYYSNIFIMFSFTQPPHLIIHLTTRSPCRIEHKRYTIAIPEINIQHRQWRCSGSTKGEVNRTFKVIWTLFTRINNILCINRCLPLIALNAHLKQTLISHQSYSNILLKKDFLPC